MRVVFVNRFFYPDHSATSQILTDLAFRLVAAGLEVEVVTSRLRYDAPGDPLPARAVHNGVRVRRVWSTRFGRRWLPGRAVDYLSFYVAATLGLAAHVGRGDVLVAMTDPPLISVPAAAVARWRGAVLVNWLQDLFPEVAVRLGLLGAGQRWLTALRDASLRAARANVVLGERMAERVGRRPGVGAERVRIIHNWADADAVVPVAPADNPLRREWGLGERLVVGYSGNLGRAHDFEGLLQAAVALGDDHRIAFLFIGGGAQLPALRRRVEAHGLANVVFRPYQPRQRLSHSLSAADIHVVSLRPDLEGLVVPSKFYGAAAAARPVLFLGDDDGEVARLCRRHGVGFTVHPADGEALAALLRRLAGERRELAACGARARHMLESEFHLRHALGRWLALLGALEGGAGVSRRSALVTASGDQTSKPTERRDAYHGR